MIQLSVGFMVCSFSKMAENSQVIFDSKSDVKFKVFGGDGVAVRETEGLAVFLLIKHFKLIWEK